MFNFNFNIWDGFDWGNFGSQDFTLPVIDESALKKVQQEIAALTPIVVSAVANSPAVVDTSSGEKPNKQEVQQVTAQVTNALAPVYVTSIPTSVFVKSFVPTIAEEIVNDPKVIKSDVGQAPDVKAVENLTQNTLDTLAADNALALVAVTQTGAPMDRTDFNKLNKILPDEDKVTYQEYVSTFEATPTPPPPPTPTIAEDPYYKVDPVTGKSQAQIDAEAAKTAASKGMLGNQNLAPETVEGEGTTKKPLTVDGEKVDGIRNGIEYDNGVAVDATRADVLKAEREAKMMEEAKVRAASDPKFNFDVRPAAPPATKDKIFYYSWIGGVNTGEWKLYEAANTEENQVKYLGRSVGGFTNASTEGAAGANTLTVQPKVEKGEIVDIGKGNVQPGGSTDTKEFVGPEGFATPMGGGTPMPKPETITGPTLTGPTLTGPTLTGPTLTGPTLTGPTLTGPTLTGPTGATGPTGPTQTYTAPDGKIFTNIDDYNKYLEQLNQENKTRQGQSAWDFLFQQFDQYGLGALVQPLKELITEGISASEMTLRLRNDPKYNKAYKERFAANDARIAKGLSPLSEAEYIKLEDQYQNIMRNYGLPETYYKRGNLGRQEGFEKFIAGDVSPTELEDRISTAQNRIIYANPEVGIALKTFYPDITNGDLLAYALDPEKALAQIKRRITAAEVGASAVQMGLATNVTDAEYLARYGVTKEQAQQGYRNVAEVLPRASMLGDIYAKQGMGPYTQQTAEQEVFNVPGAAEAAAKRRKLTELEQAQFSGRAGVGALARERAGGF